MVGHDRSYDPGEASHRALRGIQRELERHPATATVRGFPAGEYTQVVADIAHPRVAGADENATLTVSWFAGESPESRAEFSFHYSDAGNGDFGWHHHPQDHVDGWGHFQETGPNSEEYSYDPHTFTSKNPARVVWEIMAELTETLQSMTD